MNTSISAETDLVGTGVRVVRLERAMYVDFNTGEQMRYPAEFLRVYSPSAEAKGHAIWTSPQPTPIAGRALVGIVGVEPVGHYAIRYTYI